MTEAARLAFPPPANQLMSFTHSPCADFFVRILVRLCEKRKILKTRPVKAKLDGIT